MNFGADFSAIPRGHYGAVLADPPWQFKLYSEKNLKKSPQGQYRCMSLDDIMALPVGEVCAPDAACFMWTTAPFLRQSFAVLDAWGFQFKSAGAWAKQTRTGQKWMFGTGYLYRSAAEFWLCGTRGKPKQQSRSVRNLIVAPVRENSRKPDRMRADIETLMPGPYLELFARQTGEGWDCFGDQCEKFNLPQIAA